MSNTKKILPLQKQTPSKEVINNLKSFARSYNHKFSKKLNFSISWVTN